MNEIDSKNYSKALEKRKQKETELGRPIFAYEEKQYLSSEEIAILQKPYRDEIKKSEEAHWKIGYHAYTHWWYKLVAALGHLHLHRVGFFEIKSIMEKNIKCKDCECAITNRDSIVLRSVIGNFKSYKCPKCALIYFKNELKKLDDFVEDFGGKENLIAHKALGFIVPYDETNRNDLQSVIAKYEEIVQGNMEGA